MKNRPPAKTAKAAYGMTDTPAAHLRPKAPGGFCGFQSAGRRVDSPLFDTVRHGLKTRQHAAEAKKI
jgi:hypothetical protein